ncbi:hypothetical protein SOVF_028610, partial [Spinacia oleracea]
MSYPEA